VGALGSGEIGALGRAFDAMTEARGKADAARKRLVADVAHELRTPLTHLRCRIEAAQDGLLPPDAAMLQVLHEEILHLSRLVQDLQDLAMADAGALRLELQEMDAGEAARGAVEAAQAAARSRGIALDVRAPSPAPRVRADALRLRQVLANLLENALVATPAGGRVDLRVHAENGSVEFEVGGHRLRDPRRQAGGGVRALQPPGRARGRSPREAPAWDSPSCGAGWRRTGGRSRWTRPLAAGLACASTFPRCPRVRRGGRKLVLRDRDGTWTGRWENHHLGAEAVAPRAGRRPPPGAAAR
jgi:two-component system sensor histidine kinase BaeS